MKKQTVLLLMISMLIGLISPILSGCSSQATTTLYIYNWGEYISDANRRRIFRAVPMLHMGMLPRARFVSCSPWIIRSMRSHMVALMIWFAIHSIRGYSPPWMDD